jgi:hypothetical protein
VRCQVICKIGADSRLQTGKNTLQVKKPNPILIPHAS